MTLNGKHLAVLLGWITLALILYRPASVAVRTLVDAPERARQINARRLPAGVPPVQILLDDLKKHQQEDLQMLAADRKRAWIIVGIHAVLLIGWTIAGLLLWRSASAEVAAAASATQPPPSSDPGFNRKE